MGASMPLTDLQARKAPPGAKDYKLADSGGLHLFVTKKGHKSWRLKYRFDGKEKRLLLGAHPEVSLAKAREMRDEAKRLLRDGRDPLLERHKRRIGATAAAAATFEIYALRWHEAQKERWSPVHVRKVEQALQRDVLPDLGRVPISEIDGPMLLRVLRKVEARGAVDTAKRIRQHLSAVFQFAMAEGVASVDPAAGIVKGLRPTPPAGQQPAVRTMEEAREILRTMDASTSDPQTKFASRLLALTAVRPGIVRAAAWSEFEGVDWADAEAPCPDAIWRIPAVRMKLEQDDKGSLRAPISSPPLLPPA